MKCIHVDTCEILDLKVLPDRETNNLLTTVKALIKVPLKNNTICKGALFGAKKFFGPWGRFV